ncbi:CotH kinase family protein [Paenibacillus abyssi]|uniref:Inner spore coat protein H n=1 Tax=Paenibacillus abyssi TaxID=1340531 RepID=A0A917CWQ1_9BACL|nr:CotH kinase family protein [Paenibacillus abyssi]GGF99403.1 inner spore coat protein H [Paenibacillus abyssi]
MSIGGLPTRRIHIEAEHLKELSQRDVWSKRFIPIQIELDGRWMPAMLRHRGGHTRNYPKKSFEIQLEDGTTLHWNAEYDDPSMLRNALSFAFFNMIGVPASKTRHCWVEWNGQPIGIYLEIEAVDRKFFESRGIGVKSIIYAVNDNAGFGLIDPETRRRKRSLFDGYELKNGETSDRVRLISFIRKLHQLKGERLRVHLSNQLDVEQYLKWLSGAVLTGNYDGFDQNYTLFENKSNRLYCILPWDYEGTWGRNCYGKPCGSDLVRIQGYNTLTKRVLSIPEYRKSYYKLLSYLLQTAFTAETLSPTIHAMHDAISPLIRYDHTRKWTYAVFEQEPPYILNYIRERRAILQSRLKLLTKSDRQKMSILK